MKKRIALLISAVLILALFAIPASAADTVYNLIDENGADWKDEEINGLKVTRDYSGGKLTVSSTGAWPYTTSTLKTPLSFKESDNATVNLKFTVEDENAVSSIRLVSGSEQIWLHDFIKDAPIQANSGDIMAGEYNLSIKLFDLKLFAGLVEGASTQKDLVLTDDALPITGIQVWCSGSSSNIKVTIEKFEIVVPGKGGTEQPTKKVVNVAKDKSYTVLGRLAKEDGSFNWPDESGKSLTDGKFAEGGYTDAAYMGFNIGSEELKEAGKTKFEVVVDLEKKENLKKFVFYTITSSAEGITTPKSIKVYASDDQSTWSEVGDLAYDKEDRSANGKYVASLEKDAAGRYVKFEIEHNTNWVFLDEVEVYAETTSTTPGTADYGVIGFAIIALISLSGAALVSKKRA